MVAKEGKEIYNLEHYNKQEESGGYDSANQFQHFDAIRPALGIYVLRLHTGLSTFFMSLMCGVGGSCRGQCRLPPL